MRKQRVVSAFDDPTFVPMPSDPAIPLTPEQLQALFPGSVRTFVAMVDAAAEEEAQTDHRTNENKPQS